MELAEATVENLDTALNTWTYLGLSENVGYIPNEIAI